MLRLAARDAGFTLIETVILVLVIGILAAIAAPSFSAWADRYRLDNSLALLQGALQEAQHQAIRKSQFCHIMIDPTALTVTESTPGSGCLPTGRRMLDQSDRDSGVEAGFVMVTDSPSPKPTVSFSFKGTTSTANVFVIFKPHSSIPMRCLAVSQGIGMIRVGRYSSATNPPLAVSADRCQTRSQ